MSDRETRLAAYVDALLEANRRVNLTAAADPGRAASILVRPSRAVRSAWPHATAPRRAVDVGTGNGFPGVVVAVLWPACAVALVERRRKKAHAVGGCLASAGIDNAEAIACDVRELKNERPDLLGRVDLVTVRAVGSLADTNRIAAGLLAPGGRIVHWKRAAQVGVEGPAADAGAEALGLRRLPDVPHEDGVLVIYERLGPPA